MSISADDLALVKTYIGASDEDDVLLGLAWSSAVALIDDRLTSAHREVPEDVRTQLILDVSQELFKRREQQSGSSQFAVMDGIQQVRGPKDPLARCYPLLRRYVLPL